MGYDHFFKDTRISFLLVLCLSVTLTIHLLYSRMGKTGELWWNTILHKKNFNFNLKVLKMNKSN